MTWKPGIMSPGSALMVHCVSFDYNVLRVHLWRVKAYTLLLAKDAKWHLFMFMLIWNWFLNPKIIDFKWLFFDCPEQPEETLHQDNWRAADSQTFSLTGKNQCAALRRYIIAIDLLLWPLSVDGFYICRSGTEREVHAKTLPPDPRLIRSEMMEPWK